MSLKDFKLTTVVKTSEPNDLIVDWNGNICWAATEFGAGDKSGAYCYMDGKVVAVHDTKMAFNGIALNAEKTKMFLGETIYRDDKGNYPRYPNAQMVYVNYPPKGKDKLNKFMKHKFGAETKGFYGKSGTDGMSLDTQGNVFASYAKSFTIISPKGKVLGTVLPKFDEYTMQVTNTVVGNDGFVYFLTGDPNAFYGKGTRAHSGVFRVKLKNGGKPSQVGLPKCYMTKMKVRGTSKKLGKKYSQEECGQKCVQLSDAVGAFYRKKVCHCLTKLKGRIKQGGSTMGCVF